MAERSLKVPALHGGISRQPASLRFPGQVEDAESIRFSVVDGASLRQGTRHVAVVPDLFIAANYRLHPIVRDQSERYIVVYANGVFRAFGTDGTEATINFGDIGTYLEDGNANEDTLRLMTIADATFILNTLVPTAASDDGIDPTTMPLRMTRTTPGIPAHQGYTQTVKEAVPFAFWRFSEQYDAMPPFSPSNIAENAMGFAAQNAYYARSGDGSVGSLDFGHDGMTTEPGNTAIQFSEQTFEHGAMVQINSMGDFHEQIASGITFEAIVAPESGDRNIIKLRGPENNNNNLAAFYTGIVSENPVVRMQLRNVNSSRVRLFDAVFADLFDGEFHHIVFSYDPVEDEALCVIDGVDTAVTVNTTTGDEPTNFVEFTRHRIGSWHGHNSGGGTFSGRMDSVAVYARPMPLVEAQAHYGKVTDPTTSLAAVFDVDPIDWNDRASGTSSTNPVPSIVAKGSTISDIAIFRDRLTLAGDENIVLSQAGDWFNFFVEDVANVTDSDPIDKPLSTDRVTLIDYLIPFRRSLVVFTKAGRQFELSSSDILTAATAAITPYGNYETLPVRPVPSQDFLYFAGAGDASDSRLYEYQHTDVRASETATDISKHVPGLMPQSMKTVIAFPNEGIVIALPEVGNELYVHQSHWSTPSQREQSAWSRWTFGDHKIHDIAAIDNDCYMLVQTGEQFSLERLPVTRDDANRWTERPYLDGQIRIRGVYDDELEQTTFDIPYADPSLNTMVLGPEFGDAEGTVLTVGPAVVEAQPGTAPDATIAIDTIDVGEGNTVLAATMGVAIPGDYSDGPVTFGRSIGGWFRPSRPYPRDFQGTASIDGRLSMKKIVTQHVNTGQYTIRASMPYRQDRTKQFNAAGSAVQRGTLAAWFNGNAENMTIRIESSSPKPFTISAMEFLADWDSRMG